jgi:hypothetical protein
MQTKTLKFRDWVFEVDRELTKQTYAKVPGSVADSCECNDCKNYVAYRDKVFPDEIKQLFNDLGVDYKKEVEVTYFEILQNGLHHIGGWFHFKGQVIHGKDYKVPLAEGGYTFDLTKITDNFSIGFSKGHDLAYFADKTGLVQIEFDTTIPWILDKILEIG